MFVVFLGTISTVSAQSFRLKAYEFSVNAKLDGEWTGWTKWLTSHTSIFVDLDELRVKTSENNFFIIEFTGTDFDDNGRTIITKCVDKEGEICHIKFRFQFHPEIIQIYFEHSNLKIVYSVEEY